MFSFLTIFSRIISHVFLDALLSSLTSFTSFVLVCVFARVLVNVFLAFSISNLVSLSSFQPSTSSCLPNFNYRFFSCNLSLFVISSTLSSSCPLHFQSGHSSRYVFFFVFFSTFHFFLSPPLPLSSLLLQCASPRFLFHSLFFMPTAFPFSSLP